MRVLLFLVAALLVASSVRLLSAGDPTGGVDEKELKKFQGKWTVVSASHEDKEVDADAVKHITVVFEGTKITVKFKDKEGKDVVVSSTITKLDASKTPAQIDALVKDGPDKGKTGKGLYKFDGEKLTIARVEPGKERPAELASKPGSGVVLMVLKRAK
jgi:uncharacterized protein (TIGR03067 family)